MVPTHGNENNICDLRLRKDKKTESEKLLKNPSNLEKCF